MIVLKEPAAITSQRLASPDSSCDTSCAAGGSRSGQWSNCSHSSRNGGGACSCIRAGLLPQLQLQIQTQQQHQHEKCACKGNVRMREHAAYRDGAMWQCCWRYHRRASKLDVQTARLRKIWVAGLENLFKLDSKGISCTAIYTADNLVRVMLAVEWHVSMQTLLHVFLAMQCCIVAATRAREILKYSTVDNLMHATAACLKAKCYTR